MQKYWVILLFVTVIGCRKEDNYTADSPKLKLLQAKWTCKSLRTIFPDGRNYRLLNDFENFTPEKKRIRQTYLQPYYDTCVYQLLPDDSTLLFFPIANNLQANSADTATIKILNEHLFVYCFKKSNFVYLLDSLER